MMRNPDSLGQEAPQRQGRGRALTISEADVPLEALGPETVLALISGTEGPAYRPAGAGMVIRADGGASGQLSAGCIDRDVILHALDALAEGRPRNLRYGRGSPFKDLRLPCGGGLDITLLPHPDRAAIARARRDLAARRETRLELAGAPALHILPALRFLVLGKGPEARTFAEMAHAAGYLTELHAPDEETLEGASGFIARRFGHEWPAGVALDARSAVTMFFHDHDREIPLLEHALASPAFYTGAMGSLRAAQARHEALIARGVPPAHIARLSQSFGLIPSARSPRALAVSVLADIISQSRHP